MNQIGEDLHQLLRLSAEQHVGSQGSMTADINSFGSGLSDSTGQLSYSATR